MRYYRVLDVWIPVPPKEYINMESIRLIRAWLYMKWREVYGYI